MPWELSWRGKHLAAVLLLHSSESARPRFSATSTRSYFRVDVFFLICLFFRDEANDIRRAPFFKNIAQHPGRDFLFRQPVSAWLPIGTRRDCRRVLPAWAAGNGVQGGEYSPRPNSKGAVTTSIQRNTTLVSLILTMQGQSNQSTQLAHHSVPNANLSNGCRTGFSMKSQGPTPGKLAWLYRTCGQSAGVIVANPHGISCDAAALFNYPGVTLSTGKPF